MIHLLLPILLESRVQAAESAVRSAVDRTRVYVSTSDDGRIWAHGASWKASYGPEGATHIPFFGSDAPRNFPVSFAIAGIDSGGAALPFVGDATPRSEGTRVAFDRGACVERWDLFPNAVEQSFVFESLASDGDLAIRIAISTELAPWSTASGIELANDLGKVVYGKATVLDARGRSAPVETSFEEGAIEMRVSGTFLSDAAFPIVVDPVVLVFTVFSSPTYSCVRSDVAYDETTDRYLVAFEEIFSSSDHDVLTSLRDAHGGDIIDLYLDSTSESWWEPKVADNNLADQFLVVAMTSASGSAPWRIRGATELATTAYIGAPFTISGNATGSQMAPDVGGDPALAPPTFYCVVWQSDPTSAEHDIRYQLVRPDGTLVFPQTRAIDDSSGTADLFPRISKSDGDAPYVTQRWNVVWTREFATGDADVRGAQIAWDGTLVSPSFPIDSSVNDDLAPVASSLHDGASGEREWVVAFQRSVGGDFDILGYALEGSSIVTGLTSFSQLESLGGSGTYTQDQILAALDCDGSKFVLGYSESVGGSAFDLDPFIASFDLVGTTLRLSEGHLQPALTPDRESDVGVVAQHSGGGRPGRSMIVWTSYTPTYFGRLSAALYDAPIFQGFCFPGRDARPCPCGNPPLGPGRGCENSAMTGGAVLSATGTPAEGDVILRADWMKPSSACVFLQGSTMSTPGFAYGDGVRCAAGVVKRLYTKPASTGSAAAPERGDPSIPARSTAKGDPIVPGTTRCYQVYYRDPADFACAFPLAFNTTNGIVVDW